MTQWIDADRLPPELTALIDGLGAGEDLLITRNGEPIASVSRVQRSEPPPAEHVTVVATAMKLTESARSSLSAQLGPGYLVLDMHSAPRSVDVLLTPPVSPQLIAGFRSLFPTARVVIAEVEDREHGISHQGPVRRLLDAGAEVYLPSSSIPRLAEQLDRAVTQRNQLTGTTPLTIEGG
ncbi:hypothetical protein [Amycolatopsis sp. 195334CR]|uniref:hypothetical protein n=1 Tax=Amycolatopsis sp. 195334CR TaxID=2814588 RepID=UPI001A8CAAC7|nr:hypothetical protein [Amycolatopsis sp. 195334CR]MBN6039901.1 hypothetical protein [Amycolatopsis sp. 195334CR]